MRETLQKARHPVLLYTGGKDSTILLWMIHQTVGSLEKIPALILDHGLHFPETWKFIGEMQKRYNFKLVIARNADVLKEARRMGEPISVSSLSAENQHEVTDRLSYHNATFPFSLDSDVGNHLLKTVAMNQAFREHGFDYAFVGIRWDEHPARATETFFSKRTAPDHFRVHPILPLTERDIWTVMMQEKLPIHPLYAKGFRSLDSIGAEPLDDRPAWEQELGVNERAGREQDKEELMERLRALGYM
ncbi:phosphoadenosine phosphosulfate reductase family protein [Candidatus Acetothermia bacterium]|nr:phosphoadenosine phosphosulfate reductase family protein [Candidatus Acetothermia bacterium]MBI3643308.1 phosphoadenosine phosphosulfate reductase family protein [Candidatus Acetothermia bacterium]